MIDFEKLADEVAQSMFSIEEKYLKRGRIAERDALAMLIQDVISQLDTGAGGKLKNTAANVKKADALLKKSFKGFDGLSDTLTRELFQSLEEIFKQAVLPNFGELGIPLENYDPQDDFSGFDEFLKTAGYRSGQKIEAGHPLYDAVSMNETKKKARQSVINSVLTESTKAAANTAISVAVQKTVQKAFVEFFDDTAREFREQAAQTVAADLGLEYLIYTGGLIKTSREFCIKRNRKVFHISDLSTWKNDPDLIVPPATYNPILQRGGFNCRHFLMWITEAEAKERGYPTEKHRKK